MKRSPRHLASPDESEDRRRKHEDFRHHAGAEKTNPGLPHSPVPHPLRTKHHPHTQPEVYVLDADHGTHRDRPRPGKLGKKEQFRL
jgi:hypothetical protein